MFKRVLPDLKISCDRQDMNKPPLTTAIIPEKLKYSANRNSKYGVITVIVASITGVVGKKQCTP